MAQSYDGRQLKTASQATVSAAAQWRLDRSVWYFSSAAAHSSLELRPAPLHALHDTSIIVFNCVKLASCYADYLDYELSCLFIFYNMDIYLYGCLAVVRINRLDGYYTSSNQRVKLLKRTMKSETRTIFYALFATDTILPLYSAGE